MKIFFLFTILACFVYVGMQLKNNLKTRKDFYAELIAFCEDYKREIIFLKCDIDNIISKCVKQNGLLSYVIDCVNKETNITFLSQEENQVVKSFYLSLGKGDVDGEINNVDFYLSKFKQLLDKHVTSFNKYGGFSIKMSVMLGLLVCLILA